MEIGTSVKTPWDYEGTVLELDANTDSVKVLMEDSDGEAFTDWFFEDELELVED